MAIYMIVFVHLRFKVCIRMTLGIVFGIECHPFIVSFKSYEALRIIPNFNRIL